MLTTNQMLRARPDKVAVCALIQCGALYLAVSRKTDFSDFGLPGGKVDAGEDLEQALIREVLEETGYRVSVDFTKPYYVNNDDDGYTVYTFICSFAGHDHVATGAHETGVVQFVTKEALASQSSFAFYNSDLFTWLSQHG